MQDAKLKVTIGGMLINFNTHTYSTNTHVYQLIPLYTQREAVPYIILYWIYIIH